MSNTILERIGRGEEQSGGVPRVHLDECVAVHLHCRHQLAFAIAYTVVSFIRPKEAEPGVHGTESQIHLQLIGGIFHDPETFDQVGEGLNSKAGLACFESRPVQAGSGLATDTVEHSVELEKKPELLSMMCIVEVGESRDEARAIKCLFVGTGGIEE